MGSSQQSRVVAGLYKSRCHLCEWVSLPRLVRFVVSPSGAGLGCSRCLGCRQPLRRGPRLLSSSCSLLLQLQLGLAGRRQGRVQRGHSRRSSAAAIAVLPRSSFRLSLQLRFQLGTLQGREPRLAQCLQGTSKRQRMQQGMSRDAGRQHAGTTSAPARPSSHMPAQLENITDCCTRRHFAHQTLGCRFTPHRKPAAPGPGWARPPACCAGCLPRCCHRWPAPPPQQP